MRLPRAIARYVSRYDRGTFALSIAGPYALIVIAATAYVWIATHQPGSQGLEMLVLFAVTSPISQFFMFLPLDWLPPTLFLLAYTAVGLFQAWLLWLIARGRRKATPPAGALRLQDDHEEREPGS
ncbi:SCO4225 family membrane protein [Planomonospora algeriensis]